MVPRLETLHEVLLGTANFQQQLLGGLAWTGDVRRDQFGHLDVESVVLLAHKTG